MLRYSQRRPFPENFWAGVTIESNHTAWRADVLRQVQARIRFISAEPLLDELDKLDLTDITWLISGGESGHQLLDPAIRERRGLVDYANRKWTPRPSRIDWIRGLRDKCLAAGTAHFFEQWGGLTQKSAGNTLDGRQWLEFPD
jgi:protein gp37